MDIVLTVDWVAVLMGRVEDVVGNTIEETPVPREVITGFVTIETIVLLLDVLLTVDVFKLANNTVKGTIEVEMILVIDPTGQFVTKAAQLRIVDIVVT